MSRIVLLVDSNVYRNTTADYLTRRFSRPVTLINATRLSTLEIGLKDASSLDGQTVLVSALANIVSDHVLENESEDVKAAIVHAVECHVRLISELGKVKRHVLIVPPLYRESPEWFPTHMNLINETLRKESLLYTNLYVLPPFRVSGVDLHIDKVHIMSEPGKRFIDHVVSGVLDLCKGSDSVASTSLIERQDSSRPGTSANLFLQTNPEPTISDLMRVLQADVIPRLDELTDVKSRMSALEHRFYTTLSQNDVVQARLAEEIDFIKNKETRNRVVVVGFSCPDYPSKRPDQKNFLASKFQGLIESIIGEVVFDVYPKDNETVGPSGKIPPFDLRFPDEKLCSSFKKVAYQKVKESPFSDSFEGVYFNPKLTLGTRIRMEILRAISKKMVGDEEGGYCPLHNIRPILHVGPVVDGKVIKKQTLLFVDAVLRYKHLVSVPDMSFAYDKVGTGYSGVLRQNFLLLNDDDRSQPGSTLSNPPKISSRGRGTKRRFEGRGGRGFGSKRSK